MEDKYTELAARLAKVFLAEADTEALIQQLKPHLGLKWTNRITGRLHPARIHAAEARLNHPTPQLQYRLDEEWARIEHLFTLKLHSIELDDLIKRTAEQPSSDRKSKVMNALQQQAQLLNGNIKRFIMLVETDMRDLNKTMQLLRNQRRQAEQQARAEAVEATFDDELEAAANAAIEQAAQALL